MLGSGIPVDNETQAQVAEDVDNYMESAMNDLRQKNAQGRRTEDNSIDKPTGSGYQQEMAAKTQAEEEEKLRKKQENSIFNFVDEIHQKPLVDEQDHLKLEEEKSTDDSSDLRNLREKRLKQLKSQHTEKQENLAKGHGQFREIVQDEFLSEVTNSKYVIVHFYHRDFVRCEIMDHHLARLAQRHIETKFVKINAEKAPFFVDKLSIRTIPTLVFLVDGVMKGKILGFDGLSTRMPPGKEDEWPTIFLARLLGDNDMINKEVIVDDDGVEAEMKLKMEEMRKQAYLSAMTIDDDDLLDLEA